MNPCFFEGRIPFRDMTPRFFDPVGVDFETSPGVPCNLRSATRPEVARPRSGLPLRVLIFAFLVGLDFAFCARGPCRKSVDCRAQIRKTDPAVELLSIADGRGPKAAAARIGVRRLRSGRSRGERGRVNIRGQARMALLKANLASDAPRSSWSVPRSKTLPSWWKLPGVPRPERRQRISNIMCCICRATIEERQRLEILQLRGLRSG